jgi:hypothetical protein
LEVDICSGKLEQFYTENQEKHFSSSSVASQKFAFIFAFKNFIIFTLLFDVFFILF